MLRYVSDFMKYNILLCYKSTKINFYGAHEKNNMDH